MNTLKKWLAVLSTVAMVVTGCVPYAFAQEQTEKIAEEIAEEMTEQIAMTGQVTEEVPAEGVATEEVKTEEAQTEEAQTEEAQTEEAQTEEAQTEEAQTEEAQTEEAQTEEAQTEEAPAGETQTGDTSSEEAQVEETPAEQETTDETLTEEDPTEEDPTEETAVKYEDTFIVPETITAGFEGVIWRNWDVATTEGVDGEGVDGEGMELFLALQDLELCYVTGSDPLMTVGSPYTWTISAQGGVGPYEYAFNLYWQSFEATTNSYSLIAGVTGKDGSKMSFSAENNLTYNVTKYGRYVLLVGLKDEEGKMLVWQTTFYTTNDMESAMSDRVDEVVALCQSEVSGTYDTIKWVHDWLCDNVQYDNDGSIEYGSYYAERAMLEGIAVCQGYALAARILLNKLGVECIVVTGYGNSVTHAWNLVKIGSNWYHMDVTWDDTSDRYAYFLIPDGVMARDHSWSESYQAYKAVYPACTDASYYTYVRQGYKPFETLDELYEILATAASNGEESLKVCYVGREKTVQLYQNVENWIAENKYLYSISSYTTPETGLYLESVNFTYIENRTSLSDAVVTLEQDVLPYAGQALEPSVTVKLGETTLTQDKDYIVEYSANTVPGTAAITVKGIGSYEGTVGRSFTIRNTSLSECTVAAIADETYTGDAICPLPVVSVSGGVLTKDTDYTLSYVGNVAAGTAKVTISGIGYVTGTVEATFLIVPAELSSAAFDHIGSRVYTGSAIEPDITLRYNGQTLTKGTDYEVSYQNNTACGEATVTATGRGNFTGTANCTFVIVNAFVETITPDPASLTIRAGETGDISYTIAPILAQTTGVNWTSEDESVATVDGNGVVTGVSEGTTLIRIAAMDDSGVTASVTVEVLPALPEELVLARTSATMGIGETRAVACSMKPNGSSAVLTYKSSSTKVATVSADGIIKAKATGTATITVTSENGLTATMTVKVLKAPTSITLKVPATKIGCGESMKYSVSLSASAGGTVYMTSSDQAVLRVNTDGTVTGVGVGTASLTAKTYNGKTSSKTITVDAAPTYITLGAEEMEMGVGQVTTLVPEYDNTWTDIVWKSSDETVLTVENGELTALQEGTARVTVQAGSVYDNITVTVKPAPTSLVLSDSSVTLGKGDTKVITYTIPDGTAAGISIKTSNKSVCTATVEGNTVTLKAVGTGSATITVKTHNGLSATCKVTVKSAPSSVTLKYARMTLGLGESETGTTTLTKNTVASLTYTSSDESVLTVDEMGTIEAVGIGTATVTVLTHNGKKSTTGTIKVTAAPKVIDLACAKTEIGVGEKTTASYTLADGAAGECTYASDNASVATIDQNGTIVGVSAGTATISVTAYNGVTDTEVITVLPAPEKIILSETSGTIGRGDTRQFTYELPEGTAASVTVSSNSKTVCTVSTEGNVVTLKAGTTGSATITVKAHNGVKATYKITVKAAPSSVTLKYARMTLGLGESETGTTTLTKNTAASLTYTSSNDSVLTVDEKGTIKAVGIGTATITVRTHNSRTSTTGTIKVTAAPTAVDLTCAKTTLGVGEKTTATYTLPDGAVGECTYASDNASVATIDQKGAIVGVSAGTATISVTAYNGVTDTEVITVLPAPEKIILSETSGTIGRGDTRQFTYELPEGTAASVTVSSNSKTVCTVSTEGNVVTLKAGTTGSATITVKAHNGVKATYKITVKSAPSSVTLKYARMTLGLGESETGTTTLTKNTAASLTYTSSNDSVLTVDEKGTIQAVGIGTATITVRTHNSRTSTTGTIKVTAAPTAVDLTCAKTTLGVGEKTTATYMLVDGAVGACTYASDNASVATIDQTGAIKAIAVGTATISVTAYNGVKDTEVITVLPASEKITLSQYSVTIGRGDTAEITYTLPEGTEAGVTVSTSNKSVCSVVPEGNTVTLKAGYTGSATITLKTHNGVKASCKVTVKAAPSSVSLAYERMTLGLGEGETGKVTLTKNTMASLSYTSSDNGVLTVDESGTIRAVGIGTAKITVKTHNGKSYTTALITVTPAPESVTLSTEKNILGVGETYTPSVTLSEGTVGSYSFESDNEAVLTVDAETGLITAVATGSAMITVTTYNGKTDFILLSVKAAPTSLTLSGSSVTLGRGESTEIVCTIPSGTACSFICKTSSKGVATATVDKNGIVTIKAVATGTATITVKTHNGKTATCKVTVKAAPSSITLKVARTELGVGEMITATWTLTKNTSSAVNFSTSDPSVLTVTSAGVITAMGIGNATITAETFNGKTSSVSITVKSAPLSVSLEKSSLSLGINQSYTLTASLSSGAAGGCSYTSSNTKVAKVDETSGKVTGVNVGKATVSVTTYNGVSASVQVTVLSGGTIDSLLALAKTKLGCSYVYGTSGPNTFDCSGFTGYLYKTIFGISLSGSAYGQGYTDAKRFTVIESISDLQPGDVLCFNTNETDGDMSDHVAIYIADGKFVHASQTAGKVITSTFTNYYKTHFYHAIRVIG